jgi:CO/xanthine dehydrogenase FAD-binding subunit
MITVTDYSRPFNLEQALDILSSGEYTPLAGGTDLLIIMRDRKARKILDIGALKLNYISDSAGSIEIGAATTHSAIASDGIIQKNLPALGKASSLVGSQQIRNRGTIGGNIVNASPCADTVPALLLYDAKLRLLSRKGERIVPLSDFISESYKTILSRDELAHSIICNRPVKSQWWHYTKLGRRQAVNISRMTIAVSYGMDGNKIIDPRISAGSVFPKASRIPEIERMLANQTMSKELFESAARKASELMIQESGRRWSTPYKEPVLIGLLTRTLEQAAKLGGM